MEANDEANRENHSEDEKDPPEKTGEVPSISRTATATTTESEGGSEDDLDAACGEQQGAAPDGQDVDFEEERTEGDTDSVLRREKRINARAVHIGTIISIHEAVGVIWVPRNPNVEGEPLSPVLPPNGEEPAIIAPRVDDPDGAASQSLMVVARRVEDVEGLARYGLFICCGVIAVSAMISILAFGPLPNRVSSPQATQPPSTSPQPSCKIDAFLSDLDESVYEAIDNCTSPQYYANKWMLGLGNLDNYTRTHKLQLFMAASTYYSTGGPDHWKRNDSWLSYDVPECKWYSSHPPDKEICDPKTGLVHTLNFTGNGLKGTLPDEIMQHLDTIKMVDVSHNDLYGTIPEFSIRVAKLTMLDFSWNQFTGPFQVDGDVLTNQRISLETIRIQHNSFSGTVPFYLASLMPNLTYVDISNNQFTGSLPNDFQVVTKLRVLNMSYNLLSGTLGSSVEFLPNLRKIDISGNIDMFGTLPQELGNLPHLTFLDVRNTGIEGPIPQGLCRKARTGSLQLSVSGCGTGGSDGWKECCAY